MKKPSKSELKNPLSTALINFVRLGFQFVDSGQMLSFAGIVEIDGLKRYVVINYAKIFIAGQICAVHDVPRADLDRAVTIAEALLFSCESEFKTMESVLNFDKREGALLSEGSGVDLFVEQISETITNAQVSDFVNDWALAEIGKTCTFIYRDDGISVAPSHLFPKILTDCYLNGYEGKYRAN